MLRRARFYNLQLYVADQSPDGITLIEKSDLDNHEARIRVPAESCRAQNHPDWQGQRIIAGAGRPQRSTTGRSATCTRRTMIRETATPIATHLLMAPGGAPTSSLTSEGSKATDHPVQRCAGAFSDGRHPQRLLRRRA
jgi:hypothetical protein